ncbi:Hpt domain-containing protein [bacterium]|nr:Hpt domain-containing protein [bacterium]
MKNKKPIFDPKIILDNLMGDKEIAKKIFEGFLWDIPTQIKALQDFLDTKKNKDIIRQAHTIKGACANVGALSLHDIAFKMEKDGNVGEFEVIQKNMPSLSQGFEELKNIIEATIKEWKSL